MAEDRDQVKGMFRLIRAYKIGKEFNKELAKLELLVEKKGRTMFERTKELEGYLKEIIDDALGFHGIYNSHDSWQTKTIETVRAIKKQEREAKEREQGHVDKEAELQETIKDLNIEIQGRKDINESLGRRLDESADRYARLLKYDSLPKFNKDPRCPSCDRLYSAGSFKLDGRHDVMGHFEIRTPRTLLHRCNCGELLEMKVKSDK